MGMAGGGGGRGECGDNLHNNTPTKEQNIKPIPYTVGDFFNDEKKNTCHTRRAFKELL